MEFNVEQINDAFNNLPRNLRRSIYDVNVSEAIEEIGKKYKLHIDALGILETRVDWVLIGLIKTRDLYMTLREDLGMESSKVNQIIKDLNKKIFTPVREEYKSLKDLEEYQAELEETEIAEPTQNKNAEPTQKEVTVIPELEKKEEIILRQTGVEITVPTAVGIPTAVGTEPEKGRLGKEEKKILEETGMKLGRGEPIKIPTTKEEDGLDREKILAGIEEPEAPPQIDAPTAVGVRQRSDRTNAEKKATASEREIPRESGMPKVEGFEDQQQKLIEEAKERGYDEHDPYREAIE